MDDNEDTPKEFRRKHKGSIKLRALNFKQNMEILNLLEAFDEDSDWDSQFEGSKNSEDLKFNHLDSIIQINFIDQDLEKKFEDKESKNIIINFIEYQSSKQLIKYVNVNNL